MALFTNVRLLPLTEGDGVGMNFLLALVLLLTPTPSENPSARHSVTGTVVDSTGAVAPDALVQVIPRGEGNGRGIVSSGPGWVKTDQGRFSLSLLPGRYKVLAKDETDGYPDPIYQLNDDPTARFPELSVGKEDISGVQVVFGMRGGTLEGEVRDARTLKPVFQAKVTIRDARNTQAYVDVFTDKNGSFQFAVLSKPIVISATAAGYKAKAVENETAIVLSQGEHRTIAIELSPD